MAGPVERSRGMSRRQFMEVAGYTGLGFLLASCGSSARPSATTGTAAATLPDSLTISMGAEPPSWNVYAQSDVIASMTWEHIFEPLINYDFEKQAFVGCLAESWKIENDTTWVFALKKGVKFSDGTDLTAEDVQFSLNRIKTHKESLQAAALAVVESMQVRDPYTIALRTKGTQPALLATFYQRFILSKKAFERLGDDFDRNPIGSGPYKLVEWQRGDRFVLESIPDHWRKPQIKRIIFKPIPETSTRIAAFESGAVQLIRGVPPHEVARVNKLPGSEVRQVGGLRHIFMAFNLALVKEFGNLQVRQAFNHAVDVDSIVKNILEGQATKLTGPVAPYVYGFNPNIKPYPFDPEKAKALLREAGLPNGFALDIYTTVGIYTKDQETAEAVAGMLSKVGIKGTVKTPEYGIFQEMWTGGKLPFYLAGRGNIFDPDEYLSQYWATGVTKRTNFSDPAVDAALKKQRQSMDPVVRIKELGEAMQIIQDKAAAIYLYALNDSYGVKKNIEWKPRPDERILGFLARYKA